MNKYSTVHDVALVPGFAFEIEWCHRLGYCADRPLWAWQSFLLPLTAPLTTVIPGSFDHPWSFDHFAFLLSFHHWSSSKLLNVYKLVWSVFGWNFATIRQFNMSQLRCILCMWPSCSSQPFCNRCSISNTSQNLVRLDTNMRMNVTKKMC
jgi:hypothetical protein